MHKLRKCEAKLVVKAGRVGYTQSEKSKRDSFEVTNVCNQGQRTLMSIQLF